MTPTTRGLPALDAVCEKHGANAGFRLRAEYIPGAPPFPDSPEEKDWLAKRESLVLTALHSSQGWLVLSSWTCGGEERSARQELPAGALDGWRTELEGHGAWSLPGIAPQAIGEGSVEIEHEAYEYHDHDPDSLDLEAWRPPRRFKIERARSGSGAPAAAPLLQAYARFLPAELVASSPLAACFRG